MSEELGMEEKFILLQLQKRLTLLELTILLGQGLKPSEIQPLCEEYLDATVH